MTTLNHARPLLAAAALGLCPAAHAEGWGGALTLASDRVERGISQSAGTASASADLEWTHAAGFYAGLGAGSVADEAFGNSSLRWTPRAGWRWKLGDADRPTLLVLGLSSQRYPGASGQRLPSLPPRLAAAVPQPRTDFGTTELHLAASRAGFTLNADRTLGAYQGLGSAGSWHLGLQVRHELHRRISLWAGIDRQVFQGAEALNYSGWRLGASLVAWELVWALEATGTNASRELWRLSRTDGSTRELAGRTLTASVSWEF